MEYKITETFNRLEEGTKSILKDQQDILKGSQDILKTLKLLNEKVLRQIDELSVPVSSPQQPWFPATDAIHKGTDDITGVTEISQVSKVSEPKEQIFESENGNPPMRDEMVFDEGTSENTVNEDKLEELQTVEATAVLGASLHHEQEAGAKHKYSESNIPPFPMILWEEHMNNKMWTGGKVFLQALQVFEKSTKWRKKKTRHKDQAFHYEFNRPNKAQTMLTTSITEQDRSDYLHLDSDVRRRRHGVYRREDVNFFLLIKLGCLVGVGKTQISEKIYLHFLPKKEYQITILIIGFLLKVKNIKILPVQKQIGAGQRLRYKTSVIVNGHVGWEVECPVEVLNPERENFIGTLNVSQKGMSEQLLTLKTLKHPSTSFSPQAQLTIVPYQFSHQSLGVLLNITEEGFVLFGSARISDGEDTRQLFGKLFRARQVIHHSSKTLKLCKSWRFKFKVREKAKKRHVLRQPKITKQGIVTGIVSCAPQPSVKRFLVTHGRVNIGDINTGIEAFQNNEEKLKTEHETVRIRHASGSATLHSCQQELEKINKEVAKTKDAKRTTSSQIDGAKTKITDLMEKNVPLAKRTAIQKDDFEKQLGITEAVPMPTQVLKFKKLIIMVIAINVYDHSLQFGALDQERKQSLVPVIIFGNKQEISIHDLAVGDVVHQSIGDQVPADGIFIFGYNLEIDESRLLGESEVPPHGNKEKLFLHLGTNVQNGSAKMLVTTTEWGKLMGTQAQGGEEEPHLQVEVNGVATIIGKIDLSLVLRTLTVLCISFVWAKITSDSFTKWSFEYALTLLGYGEISITIIAHFEQITSHLELNRVVEKVWISDKVQERQEGSRESSQLELPKAIQSILLQGIFQKSFKVVKEKDGNTLILGFLTEKAILEFGLLLLGGVCTQRKEHRTLKIEPFISETKTHVLITLHGGNAQDICNGTSAIMFEMYADVEDSTGESVPFSEEQIMRIPAVKERFDAVRNRCGKPKTVGTDKIVRAKNIATDEVVHELFNASTREVSEVHITFGELARLILDLEQRGVMWLGFLFGSLPRPPDVINSAYKNRFQVSKLQKQELGDKLYFKGGSNVKPLVCISNIKARIKSHYYINRECVGQNDAEKVCWQKRQKRLQNCWFLPSPKNNHVTRNTKGNRDKTKLLSWKILALMEPPLKGKRET